MDRSHADFATSDFKQAGRYADRPEISWQEAREAADYLEEFLQRLVPTPEREGPLAHGIQALLGLRRALALVKGSLHITPEDASSRGGSFRVSDNPGDVKKGRQKARKTRGSFFSRQEVFGVIPTSFFSSFDWNLVEPPALVRAWRREFVETPVTIQPGDIITAARSAAIVSPANSFGWMDGGLDALIAQAYAEHGVDITAQVQAAILAENGGELPVGSALVVSTSDSPFTHCIAAPTMRTPRPVPWSFHAYLVFRTIGVAVMHWNCAHADDPIRRVFCPGLGTGVGRIPPRRAARQMRAAWNQLQTRDMPPLWEALKQEAVLRGTWARDLRQLRGTSRRVS